MKASEFISHTRQSVATRSDRAPGDYTSCERDRKSAHLVRAGYGLCIEPARSATSGWTIESRLGVLTGEAGRGHSTRPLHIRRSGCGKNRKLDDAEAEGE
jgi:hypothetical protein